MATTKKTSRKKARRRARPFWSGTLTFGLVNIPVELFPANRSATTSLRMLDADGTPLSRRYYCERHQRDIHAEHIVRGFRVKENDYVVLRDEELEAIEPRKTRDIDLRQFAPADEIPPLLFEHAYFLIPVGKSTKAYRLLAEVLEQSGQVGIATFVMRTKEHLVAILAENGILRAETLRFADEVREPSEVGLPEPTKVNKKRVAEYEKAMRKLMKEDIDTDHLRDEYAAGLRQLAERKYKRGEDVVVVPEQVALEEEEESLIDLLESIREGLRRAKHSRNHE